MKHKKLFCPGPVETSKKVKDSMRLDIGHREKEFEELFKNTKSNILKLAMANDEYDSVIISGSGTAANESVISSLIENNQKVLLLSNGVFGERLEEIISKYQITYDIYPKNWGETINVNQVETMLQSNQYDYILMVFHETSCSKLNPVKEIGLLAKKYKCIFYVDCVSAFGGEDFNIVELGIDIATAVSGKCVGAFPGASYVIAKKSIFENIDENKSRNVYLSLAKHYKYSTTLNQTPNTPNVVLILALNTALEECLKDNKYLRYKNNSEYLRSNLKNLGISFVTNEEEMASSLTTIILPSHIEMPKFHSQLLENGFVTYAGKGKYYDMNCLQVAVMGEIYKEDIDEFLEVFKKLL